MNHDADSRSTEQSTDTSTEAPADSPTEAPADSPTESPASTCSTSSDAASKPVCPACGGNLINIRAKLQCERCHTICETCCEGGRG